MSAWQERLFGSRPDLSGVCKQRADRMRNSAAQLTPEKVADEAAAVNRLRELYELEPIVLGEATAKATEDRGVVTVTVDVPFQGSDELLLHPPSQTSSSPPVGQVNGKVITFAFKPDTLEPEPVKQRRENFLANLAQWVSWANADAITYNNQLATPTAEAVAKRIETLGQLNALRSELA